MATITGHTTRSAGTILTAAIYNSDHVNHITNATTLNTSKLEGASGPVVDGHGVIFNGTTGAGLRTLSAVPAIVGRIIAAGAGLSGGGDLAADRTLTVNTNNFRGIGSTCMVTLATGIVPGSTGTATEGGTWRNLDTTDGDGTTKRLCIRVS